MKNQTDLVTNNIQNAPLFAQPILFHLRTAIHQYCPEIEEVIKWNFPCFKYKNGILCFFASHKQHCSFGFWLASEMTDRHGVLEQPKGGMGAFGKITSLEQLPSASILNEYLQQGINLINAGVTIKKAPKKTVSIPEIPNQLWEALNNDAVAKSVFDNFPPSQRKEYIVWLLDAKTEATFHKRLALTLSNLHEGKTKDWKYRK